MDDCIHKIGEFINEPRRQYYLLKKLPNWNQLCSSLDTIGDTSMAIDAYFKSDYDDNNDGEKYLKLYGLLQAMFLQQDATQNLSESLNLEVNINKYPELMKIRKIRNKSIGHPTNKGNHDSFHYISRTSINKEGFQIYSYHKDNKTTNEDIALLSLIENQKKYLTEILSKIVEKMEFEEKAHKERFKMIKLESVISNMLAYHVGKLKECASLNQRFELGKISSISLNDNLLKVKTLLKERGIELSTYDSIGNCYELLEYPLNELKDFFEGKQNINNKTTYIFSFFVEKQINDLNTYLKDIDDYYAN